MTGTTVLTWNFSYLNHRIACIFSQLKDSAFMTVIAWQDLRKLSILICIHYITWGKRLC